VPSENCNVSPLDSPALAVEVAAPIVRVIAVAIILFLKWRVIVWERIFLFVVNEYIV